jgi:hydrogenase maturation protein HypF
VKAVKIQVNGVVQGVGFRPFVYRVAGEHGVHGWVRNTSGDVEIVIEGSERAVDGFVADLKSEAPPLARIDHISVAPCSLESNDGFEILESMGKEGEYQLVSPDIATCSDCRREIFDPKDRRYRYPFTNCTNCGPRFTIIDNIPYDRKNTTMRKFRMCRLCRSEYDDPMNRRFHAQPNACPECGPKLSLVDKKGEPVACDDAVTASAEFLRKGKIIAVRGLGGFQLACDATNAKAVGLLRKRKQRPSRPFAVMFPSIDEIKRHCVVSRKEKELLESSEAPIVLLKWKRSESNVTTDVAERLNYMGAMLPYTPLHHLLMRDIGIPLVMTSGNLSEEPIAKDNDEALRRLGGIADYFLLHDRDIYARYDDSVCIVEREPQTVRRARGYAPYPIKLGFEAKQILACGAELKNTFCLTRGRDAFVSQHIGDMENAETLEHFENTVELYEKMFRVEPEAIACDMHPEYLATKYAHRVAESLGLKLIAVQHHHAHIVSCMADNYVEEPVIGVALDGTGYGTDGAIWGGEFLVAEAGRFVRMGCLEYVPLLGGEAAIKKPYRMALSYIWTMLGEDFPLDGLSPGEINREELALLKQQLQRGLNCPPTSSAGRLFDAVSAIAGVCGEISYEAQAAIELEMAAEEGPRISKLYPFEIIERNGIKTIKLANLIAEIVKDVRKDVGASRVSLKFHKTVAQIVTEMCSAVSKDTGIKTVALSGGVFQNRLLARLVVESIEANGFRVLTHSDVPCSDGCISLGQAVVANSLLSG